MRQRDKQVPKSAEETVRHIRRATRRQFSAEESVLNSQLNDGPRDVAPVACP